MKCEKCLKDFPENEIHEHHIHPRFMNNKKGEGKKAWLCEKCHNILHLIIPSIIFKFISNKQSCINAIISFTNKWIEKKEDDTRTIKEP